MFSYLGCVYKIGMIHTIFSGELIFLDFFLVKKLQGASCGTGLTLNLTLSTFYYRLVWILSFINKKRSSCSGALLQFMTRHERRREEKEFLILVVLVLIRISLVVVLQIITLCYCQALSSVSSSEKFKSFFSSTPAAAALPLDPPLS